MNPAWVRQRFRNWWQSRLPLRDVQVLTQRNVYILPTRPGLMLAVTLMALLVASINYQLNLGYLLTFLLAGCAIVGMHVCHGTLRGLRLQLQAPEPQFAGAATALEVVMHNERRSPRIGIGLAVLDAPGERHWAWSDVPAQGQASVQVTFRPEQRGVHVVPPLTAETRFPLGTFRVWTVWRPAAQVVVYPRPEPFAPPLPAGEPRVGQTQQRARATAGGEFDGVRPYRRGDGPRLVVWKKFAKAGELVSRETEQHNRLELWLDFDCAGSAGTEARLSRLCAWVVEAEKQGLDYGLRLPGIEIAPAQGEVHRRACLEALARC